MADYAEAMADYDLLDATLRRAELPAYLPAVQPAPAPLYQPVPLPEQGRPRLDVVSVRLLAGGGSIALAGLGVDLAGNGIKVAGPYFYGLAAVLGALAAVIALLKSKAGAPSQGTTVNFNGGKNRVGSIR